MSAQVAADPQIAVAGGGPGDWEWSWVDFSLGEDVRNEHRLMQDEKWRDAVSDGRAHVSHREFSLLHKEEFIGAIQDYHQVNEILRAYQSQKSVLSKLNVEIIKHIVDFALPGQGPLVLAAAESRLKSEKAGNANANANANASGKEKADSFRICVRCRPLLDYELDIGMYSCVDLNSNINQLIVHEGKMARNGRRLTMTHKKYNAHRIWNTNATNEEVCASEVQPLLQRAFDGYAASLICFGQTGTGKTYTLMAALEYALTKLHEEGFTIEVTFFELHGKKCYDLLSGRKVIHLRSDENENVHARGARTVVAVPSFDNSAAAECSPCVSAAKVQPCDTSDDKEAEEETGLNEANQNDANPAPSAVAVSYSELFEVLHRAIKLRSSEETERNPISSRSHAVCVVKLLSSTSSSSSVPLSVAPEGSSKLAPINRNQIAGGKLTFVDLAGSERNYETIKMTAAQHRESADINFSLMALKDCFRAYYAQMNGLKMMHRMTRVESQSRSHLSTLTYQPRCKNPANDLTPARAPYRASLLTRVLRECFVNCSNSNSVSAPASASSSARVSNESGKDPVSGQSTKSDSSSSSGRAGTDTDEDMMKSLEAVAALTDNRHYTTIITTVGPTPTDVQHTINSLDHVMLMSPKLHPLVTSITVEVPLKGLALSHLPIETWTPEQVNAWLATACGGRFAQLVLPPGLDGAGLMNLNMVSLSALCEGKLRTARQDGEGAAWVVNAAAAEENRHNYLGRALWAALRMQQQQQRIAAQEIKP